jgi:cytochrome c peroxidase
MVIQKFYWFMGFALIVYLTMETNVQKKSFPSKDAMAELGHYFFFDKKLSYNFARSCASCHDPFLAFTDGYRLSLNSEAQLLKRNAPSLLNINQRTSFDWSNPDVNSMILQMERPLFSVKPVELGLTGNEEIILQRFRQDKLYQQLYENAFHKSILNLSVKESLGSIAAYEISLQSRNSIYDQYLKSRDSTLFTSQEWMGLNLFFSDSISCNRCHGGLDFFEPERGGDFANIGLYNCEGSYPVRDLGLQEHTGDVGDNGVFRIPGLRNVALTGPYYHDGSSNSLEEVIKNYERGGRLNSVDDCEGDGAMHPNSDGRMQNFQLDEKSRKAIIAFLHTLTDTSYLRNEYFLDPFNP